MSVKKISVDSFLTKVLDNEKKSLEPSFDNIADSDNIKWIVRWVGDSETEYMKLFTCSYKNLHKKILDDVFFKEMLKYELDDNNNEVYLTNEQLKIKAKEAINKQTHSIRILPLSVLETGLNIQMRMNSVY